jgi:hypothetical protein
MSRRRLVGLAGGVGFLLAGVSAAVSSQLTTGALGVWASFVGTLAAGAAITGWLASRTPSPEQSSGAGPAPAAKLDPVVVLRGPGSSRRAHVGDVHVGDVSADRGGQAAGVNYGTVSRSADRGRHL